MRWVYQTERSLGEMKSLLLEIVSVVLYVNADDKAAQTVTLDKLLAVSIVRYLDSRGWS
jgi:hypothetical protein